MRHIEIRRKDCLNKFDSQISDEDKWLEKHDIAIARFAKKYREYRVLNTTYKLNDWAFPYYQKKISKVRIIRYLSALVEQEQTTTELMQSCG